MLKKSLDCIGSVTEKSNILKEPTCFDPQVLKSG